MKSLFNTADRNEILGRLESLQAGSVRQWGKMTCPQMLCHLSIALETGTGDRPMKQSFLGHILAPFVTRMVLGEKPFGRNGPTDPSFVVADERDFTVERTRLTALIRRLADRGAAEASKQTHPFFGRLSGEQWGVLMYKHIDHHLRQFSA